MSSPTTERDLWSSQLTNDFNDIIDVAKSISTLSSSQVTIFPIVSVRKENVNIDSCHFCLIPANVESLEERLAFAQFIPIASRDNDGFQWDDWERETVKISIGKRI